MKGIWAENKLRMAKQLNARTPGQGVWGTGIPRQPVVRSSDPSEPTGGIQVAKLPAEQKESMVVVVAPHTSVHPCKYQRETFLLTKFLGFRLVC